jgi:hypothetical protein
MFGYTQNGLHPTIWSNNRTEINFTVPVETMTITDSFPDQNGEVSVIILQQEGIELFLSKSDAIGVAASDKRITFFAGNEEISSLEYPGTGIDGIEIFSFENENNRDTGNPETKVLISLDNAGIILDLVNNINYKIIIDEGFFVVNNNNNNIFNVAFTLEFETGE